MNQSSDNGQDPTRHNQHSWINYPNKDNIEFMSFSFWSNHHAADDKLNRKLTSIFGTIYMYIRMNMYGEAEIYLIKLERMENWKLCFPIFFISSFLLPEDNSFSQCYLQLWRNAMCVYAAAAEAAVAARCTYVSLFRLCTCFVWWEGWLADVSTTPTYTATYCCSFAAPPLLSGAAQNVYCATYSPSKWNNAIKSHIMLIFFSTCFFHIDE